MRTCCCCQFCLVTLLAILRTGAVALAACDDDDIGCSVPRAVGGSLLHVNVNKNVAKLVSADLSPGWKRGSCSFEVELSCQEWCLKPAWTQQVHSATRLSCCKPEDGSEMQKMIGQNTEPAKLAIAMLYTDETDMLRQHLRNWIQFSPKLLQRVHFFIAIETQGTLGDTTPWDIVQEELETLGSQGIWPDISLIGLHERLNWNIGGKRNLLLHVASQIAPTWVLLTDVDMSFSESMLSQMLIISGTPGSANSLHKFNRQRPNGEMAVHPGTWLMTSELYWRAGGCDEDFVGSYGMTDPHFDWRAGQAGIPTEVHTELVLHEIEHGGDGRFRDASYNSAMFQRKMYGEPWSNRFLRFRFGQITCTIGNRLVR